MSAHGYRAGAAAIVLGLACVPRAALAWDPATTHSGLTGRAIAASKLHAALAERLGRPLGLFEPLHLDFAVLDADTARTLRARLERLDDAGGYRPSAEGMEMAEAWVRAGAVLEKTPPERGRNHFFDPRRDTGLDDNPGLSGAVHAVRLVLDDDTSVREAVTGQAFDLEGMPALAWLDAPENDLGLHALVEHWTRAVTAARPVERETELVRTLLALGGTLSVLEDMGQPAFVRNDFRGDFLRTGDGSPFERFVAARYGAVALPPPAASVVRPDSASYFTAADGQGLAQRTQASFFSPGTVPADVRVAANESGSDLATLANRSLAFPSPAVTALQLGHSGRTHYVVLDGGRVLAYQRTGNRIHFFFDEAVYADCARRWLPVVEAYALGLVDHLLRVTMDLAVVAGKATVRVVGLKGDVQRDTDLHVVAEDAAGLRTEIGHTAASSAEVSFSFPVGSKKIAAVVHGRDAGGAFVAAAEIAVP